MTIRQHIRVFLLRTRIQNMKFVDGKGEYRGAGHCFQSIVKNEGVLSLWKGFLPYYFRLGPHTVLAFVFMEQLNQAYKARMWEQSSLSIIYSTFRLYSYASMLSYLKILLIYLLSVPTNQVKKNEISSITKQRNNQCTNPCHK